MLIFEVISRVGLGVSNFGGVGSSGCFNWGGMILIGSFGSSTTGTSLFEIEGDLTVANSGLIFSNVFKSYFFITGIGFASSIKLFFLYL